MSRHDTTIVGTTIVDTAIVDTPIEIAPLTRDAVLTPGQAAALDDMTFPAYRHFLALQPAPRHADEGDARVVEPLVLAAWRGGVPVGLAVAELPVGDTFAPELLSLYVRADARDRGIATRLIAALEAAVRARGFDRLEAVYMTGAPGIDALERVWQKNDWEPPAARTVSVRFTPDQLASMPWFGRVRLPEPAFSMFPWTALTREDKQEMARSHLETPWMAAGLEPWRHDHHGFDPVSSIGLRYHGRVVGWFITHRLAPDFVRFTCSFMRVDLSRRGRSLALYTESVRRLQAEGRVRMCSMITPVRFTSMVAFIREHIAPWATSVGETRGTHKTLADAGGPRQANQCTPCTSTTRTA